MSTAETAPFGRLKLGTALRAHVRLIATLTFLLSAAAATVAYLLPTQYVATASVLVQPLDGNPYSPDGAGSDLTRLETEAQVVSSDVIVSAVKDQLPGDMQGVNLTNGLGVAIPPNTQIIDVTFRAARPEVAEEVSALYATAYLAHREERRDAFVQSREDSITERVNTLNEDLEQFRREGRGANSPEVRAVSAQLQNLRLQLSTLETSSGRSGEIIVNPVGRRSGLSVPVGLAAGAGALVGFILGSIIAVTRERRLELLRTVDDIEHVGVPVLGHVAAGAGLALDDEDPIPDAALMVAAVLTRRVKGSATVAVSGLSGHAELGLPAHLGRALAQGAQSVLLIEGADRTGGRDAGLSEALTSRRDLMAIVRKRSGLTRLSVGRDPDSGERLYGTPRMDTVLARATEEFDWVIVHARGTDETGGRALVGGCGHWVPVVVLGETSREDLERGLLWARTSGTKTVGVVAIDRPRASKGRARTAGAEAVD